ncbi:GNAT family N-acetyltransferase [Legionella rowbothamii]|uniref:GNAT family N-acetyltransferase n=1 Tax=Legionella rowbothamii TaxID=96229 RepID=UPI001A9469B5|nr:GNAT family N-acetyltransferase [Legionella rowbothamii]
MSKLPITLRKLKEADMIECMVLFQNTVHSINAKDYSITQLEAWAPKTNLEITTRWKSLLENITYVAEYKQQIVGFGDLTHQGYLDRLFVHRDYQGRGIAAAIVKKLALCAQNLNLQEIAVEASITAKPFFERYGFTTVKEQQVKIRGEELTNFVMRKALCKKLPLTKDLVPKP